MKKPETNHLRLPSQPLTVATSRSWRGWVAAGSTESVSGKNKKTERGGFEPPKAFDLTRLPIVHLRPLGHLSNSIGNYIRKAVDSSSGAIICVSIAAIAASNASEFSGRWPRYRNIALYTGAYSIPFFSLYSRLFDRTMAFFTL